jgi:hypothetical protein
MPFSLTEIEVKRTLQEPGCPLCGIARSTAERYIRHLLWESVNDEETRRHFIAGLGYCPDHTRLLASTEVERHGDALGVNTIYENLVNVIEDRLKTWQPPEKAGAQNNHSGKARRDATRLAPASVCRVCQIADQSTNYALKTLLEELEAVPDDWQPLYSASDGLCLAHLKECLQAADRYPVAIRFIHQDALSRLNRWRKGLQRYSHKRSWEFRDEPMAENESHAWKEVLAFFTGQPPGSFEE